MVNLYAERKISQTFTFMVTIFYTYASPLISDYRRPPHLHKHHPPCQNAVPPWFAGTKKDACIWHPCFLFMKLLLSQPGHAGTTDLSRRPRTSLLSALFLLHCSHAAPYRLPYAAFTAR